MKNIRFKIIKDHPTVSGMLYKDEVVMVDKKYKSFIGNEKIQVKDLKRVISIYKKRKRNFGKI